MPYTATRRLYHIVGKKISKYLSYRKAKRIYNEINRDMAAVELRFVRSKLHHA